MSITTVWSERARKRYALLLERQRKLGKRIFGKPGKMPHWSTYKRREDMKTFSHLLRPPHENNGRHTLCGWNEAAFQSARAFNLPRHELWPAQTTVRKFLTQGGAVGCERCFEVANDIATWVGMINDPHYGEEFTHLRWSSATSGELACGAIYAHQTFLFREYAEFISEVSRVPDACSICTAIFGRLFGPNRPENEYTSYTTNEEASLMRGGMRP